MQQNKVCVYTICKNEEKNIRKWLESVKDADLVCLIDTGSTDYTIPIIEEFISKSTYKPTLIYDILHQDEFSFSVARNYCLDVAKTHIIKNYDYRMDIYNNPDWLHDTEWVFVSLDLDEFIEPGGINEIKEKWNSSYDTMEIGVNAISFDEDGNKYIESTSFVHHKVHSKDFHWVRDVHEIIEKPGVREDQWSILYTVITYEHIQDKNKERNYYQLLKNSFNKGDKSSKTLIYLAWEAYEHSDFESVYNYASLGLNIVLEDSFDQNYMDFQYILCFRRYLALYFSSKSNWTAAYNEYLKCIDIFATGKFPRTRVIYREIARVAWEIDKVKAIMYYSQFFDIHCPEEYWVEDFNLYTYQAEAEVYSELSNAYFYCDLGYDWKMQSIFYAELACGLDSENETIQYNLDCLHKYFRENTPEV